MVTEFGRYPWIVYGELKVEDAISLAVPAWQVLITILLFLAVYTLLFVVWARMLSKTVKAGPEAFLAEGEAAAKDAAAADADSAPSYFDADATADAAAERGGASA